MSLARETSIVSDLAHSNYRGQPAAPISLNVMSPLVAIFDLIWIVVLGVVAGLLYDHVALGGNGEAQNYLGSSIAVATLYSAFGHAAKIYRGPNLRRLKWQVERSALIWLMAFVFLASIAFLLKTGAAFSRGEMLLFFASGIFAVAVMRLIVAHVCAFVISSGALKPTRVILVGSADELAANDALFALERYGYAVVDVFAAYGRESGLRPGLIDGTLAGSDPLRQRRGYRRNNRSDTVAFNGPSRQGRKRAARTPGTSHTCAGHNDRPCTGSPIVRTGPDEGGTTPARSAKCGAA